MAEYAFRIVNVFGTENDAFSGNPLCVFEDAAGMDDATMRALAVQFNLSETTFVLPSRTATARVRIFAPSGEMPFAGHPTLGTARVVRERSGAGDELTLEMLAGVIPVRGDGDTFTLTAAPPTWRETDADRDALAAMLTLSPDDIGMGARWVSTGNEQLLVPLESEAALMRAVPVPPLVSRWANDRGMVKVYCFVPGTAPDVPARFFFEKQTGVIAEDPGTGSACANLGGWFLAEDCALPHDCVVRQGDHLGRACRLTLSISGNGAIAVGGRTREVARGSFHTG